MRVRRTSVAASVTLLATANGLPVPAENGGRHGSQQSAACDPSTSFHFMHLGVCHCPCVLIDVGLNTGKSLMTWGAEAATRAERHSDRLAECASSGDTCYYGFEANPVFDTRLQSLETKLRAEGRRVKIFTSTVFNLHGNAAEFMVDRSTRQNSEGEAVTSTLESSKRLVFQDRAGNWRHRNATVAERFKRTLVRSTDASAFFASVLGASTGFAGAKIDVEGFEYTLLPHLLLRSPRTLCDLDVLAVEWHEPDVKVKFAGHTDHLIWFLTHAACNVTLLDWK